MVLQALAAAETLAAEGIDAEVIDLRTLAPLDTQAILASVRKTGRLVTVEEAPKTGGVGGEIAALVAEEALYSLEAPIRRLGAPFTPVPEGHGLEQLYYPNAGDIVAAVKEAMD
jgi:pyruvate dehydrogenase E1 component beta subunit